MANETEVTTSAPMSASAKVAALYEVSNLYPTPVAVTFF